MRLRGKGKLVWYDNVDMRGVRESRDIY